MNRPPWPYRRALFSGVAAGTGTLVLYFSLRFAGYVEGPEGVLSFWLSVLSLCVLMAPFGLALLWSANAVRTRPPLPRLPLGQRYCRACHYPREGLPGDRCPECGQPAFVVNLGREPYWIGDVLAGVAAGVIVAAVVCEGVLALAL